MKFSLHFPVVSIFWEIAEEIEMALPFLPPFPRWPWKKVERVRKKLLSKSNGAALELITPSISLWQSAFAFAEASGF